MKVIGLENDYYLSGNNIWIEVSGFTRLSSALEVVIKRLETQTSYGFNITPNADNTYLFNISEAIRGLLPSPNHIDINTLQSFEITFKAFFNTGAETETITLTKNFIRGWRRKEGVKEWHLNEGDSLVVGKWIEWGNLPIAQPKKIIGGRLVTFIPSKDEVERINIRGCKYKIIKFLNSLGGYQCYVFENSEEKTKTKGKKTISKIKTSLRQNNFFNLGIEADKTIELHTKTKRHLQPIITDLVQSYDVYLFDPDGVSDESQWHRLVLESNDSVENTYDNSFENKISFSFYDDVMREL
ncbi:hypothetical protein JSO60_06635 [Riemerella anatipestifer]|uniref:hypothetical protein n=1 Tax=Riemerella anatipestifer TaxID=34085 RepID=UPI0030BC32D0